MFGADDTEDMTYNIRGSSLWRMAASFDSKRTFFIARNLRQSRGHVFCCGRHYNTRW